VKIATALETLETMEVSTKSSEKFICRFPIGIIGFPHSTNFELLHDPRFFPFMKLRSLEEPGLEFAIIDPWIVKKDYCVEITDADLETLRAKESCELMIFSIITLYPEQASYSLNLAAPVIINIVNKTAIQIIVEDSSMQIRYFVELGD